jgi:hypothetical protein
MDVGKKVCTKAKVKLAASDRMTKLKQSFEQVIGYFQYLCVKYAV